MQSRMQQTLLLLLLLLHPFNSIFFRTTWVSQYQKGKTSLDLNEARNDGVLGCSGISWTICKQSVPCFRQITTPTPHHWIFLQAGCSSCRQTNSVRAPKALKKAKNHENLKKNLLNHVFPALKNSGSRIYFCVVHVLYSGAMQISHWNELTTELHSQAKTLINRTQVLSRLETSVSR